jgi:3-phosphoshikimate 1-carboxyvinyltransferase
MAQDHAPSVRIPAGRVFSGRLTPPPSKSVTNRYLNLAVLAGRPLVVERPLLAADTRAFLAALPALGMGVEVSAGAVRSTPVERAGEAAIDCGASGTMARFLTATLAALPGTWRLDGTTRLRDRPLAPLLAALRELGAVARPLQGHDRLPLEIEGRQLSAGRLRLDAAESSQYLSALLMAATRAAGPVEIEVGRLVSAPYVDLTLEALRAFGARVEVAGGGLFRVVPGLPGVERVAVEADWSAACYPAAAAVVTGGAMELSGLSADSAQADRRFFDLLARMGAELVWRDDGKLVVSRSAELRAIEADLRDLPDQAPTLAVVAAFARGVTCIRNVGHLRLKESDRLAAVCRELARCGVPAAIEGDDLVVPGVWAEASPESEPVQIETYDDHRLAMAFAVLGLRRPGVSISHPRVVEKSYPGFWVDFRSCTSP